MPKAKEPIILAWSGGKDSVMALWEMRKAADHQVISLVSVINEEDQRIPMHGIPRRLLEKQARAISLPLEFIPVPKGAPNHVYLSRLNAVLSRYQEQGIRKVAFGDLYLDDLRDFREENLEAIGMEAIFPLWHRDTKELSYAFINAKFKAIITSVDEQTLTANFAGRPYDKSLLADLPITVDPCGENGEFHTFVYDGPLFKRPVPIKLGDKHSCDHLHFCEVAALSKSS